MKNKVLKTITGIVAVMWVISAGCLDSGELPTWICIGCTIYLGIFLHINQDYFS